MTKADRCTHLGTGFCVMGVDPQSDPGPSTSAYLSSRWTSRLSHEAPRCESVSMRSTMLEESCASSHAAWTSSTELRSMRGYGTAQRKRPARLCEGGGGFLHHKHTFSLRLFWCLGCVFHPVCIGLLQQGFPCLAWKLLPGAGMCWNIP